MAAGGCGHPPAQNPTAVFSTHDRTHAVPARRPHWPFPPGQRAELVHDLLASLEPAATENPDQVAAAWSRELERRGHASLNGTAPGTEWATVRDRLRDELVGE